MQRGVAAPSGTAWCARPIVMSSAQASTLMSQWVPSCRPPSATRCRASSSAPETGTSRATSPHLAPPDEHGCYVAPTVLTDVDPAMEIWTEEVFGPVVALVAFDTLDEALDLVNASQFGLAAAIYTSDLSAAHAFAERADVGQVAVNLPTSGWDVHMPFGGFKSSGSGHKEQGPEGLDFYRRTKTVALHSALTDADDPSTPDPDYPHWDTITTRWMDNDMYGHVNNVQYYSFFDTVVTGWLVRDGGLDPRNGEVIGLCVESQCTYSAPLSFPDEVLAGLRVGHVGRSSVRYESRPLHRRLRRSRGVRPLRPRVRRWLTRRPAAIPEPLRVALSAWSPTG